MLWHRAIRALGLQFEYATDRMLRRGEFQEDQCKVLILSQCEALGPREAEVIRKLSGRHFGRLPLRTLVQIWREIISASVHIVRSCATD